MRNAIFIFFDLLLFNDLKAQKAELALKNFPVILKSRDFYISKVTDSRNDSVIIGWSTINKETKGSYYTLRNGTQHALTSYLLQNLAKDSNDIPLVMNIVSLYIREKGKIIKGAEAYVSVQFLREKNGLYGKVFETRAFTESSSEVGTDIYSTHERRIRIVINECLKNLNEYGWQSRVPDYITETEIRKEAMEADTISRKIADTTGLFSNRKKEDLAETALSQILYKKGIVPEFQSGQKKSCHLWSFSTEFRQTNDMLTQKLFTGYKAKFRLTFCALGIGAALVAVSFNQEASYDNGPNLSFLIPGAVFSLCSVPVYIKTNKLSKKTVQRYNSVIRDK